MAYWVCLYHVRDAYNIDYFSDIIDVGYLGVDVFFSLSGYIMTHVYQKYYTTSFDFQNYKIYIKRRFARIYPLHFFTLIGAVLFLWILNNNSRAEIKLDYNDIPFHLFLIHAWGFTKDLSFNFPSWSVSAEWFAYLFVFPFSIKIFHYKGIKFLLFLVVMFYLSYVFITYTFFYNNVGSQLETGFIRIVPEFMLGSSIYLVYWKYKLFNKPALFVLSYLLMGIIAFLFTKNFQFIFLLLIPFALIHLHLGSTLSNLFFGSKPIIFLGEISYSIYMVHFFSRSINGIIFNNFLEFKINSFLYLFVYTTLTILFAILTFYFIENPFRRLINRKSL